MFHILDVLFSMLLADQFAACLRQQITRPGQLPLQVDFVIE